MQGSHTSVFSDINFSLQIRLHNYVFKKNKKNPTLTQFLDLSYVAMLL